ITILTVLLSAQFSPLALSSNHRHQHTFPTRRSSDLPQRHGHDVLVVLGVLVGAVDADVPHPGLGVRVGHLVGHLDVDVVAMTYRSEEHTSELQSQSNLVCRLLLEKKKKIMILLYILC